jgi:hypothetical protein
MFYKFIFCLSIPFISVIEIPSNFIKTSFTFMSTTRNKKAGSYAWDRCLCRTTLFLNSSLYHLLSINDKHDSLFLVFFQYSKNYRLNQSALLFLIGLDYLFTISISRLRYFALRNKEFHLKATRMSPSSLYTFLNYIKTWHGIVILIYN